MKYKSIHISKDRLGYNIIFFILGFFLILNGSITNFQKKAKIGDLWKIISVRNISTFYALSKIPEEIDIAPYWKSETNRYFTIKQLPIEISIIKIGGTNKQKYFFVDFYTTHQFIPKKKYILASGWIQSWLVTKAEKLIDKNRSKILEGITFAIGSYKITSFPKTIINKINTAYQKNKKIRLMIEGYTDNSGSETYNLTLSVKRAKSVANYIIEKLKIPKDQVSYIGFGESNPRTDNSTKAKRTINRRIEMKIFK